MAEFGTVSIGFAVKVSAIIEVRTAPTRHAIVNRFDEHGDTFSLDRLPLESNTDFRKRILDSTLRPGGPDYEGLVNNLSRELGSPRFPALVIDTKKGSDGSPLAKNPRVDILADRVILYNDWEDHGIAEIDAEINIYDIGSAGYFLSGLVSEINKSEYFFASLAKDARSNTLSTCLIRGNTYGEISDDTIKNDQFTILSMRNIVKGSIWFDDKDTFRTEVSGEPESDGEYRVDYDRGYVVSHKASVGGTACGYFYSIFPFNVDASMIQVYGLHDQNYVAKLFNQEILLSGEEINALPNTEGAEVIHQLFKECPTFWGE